MNEEKHNATKKKPQEVGEDNFLLHVETTENYNICKSFYQPETQDWCCYKSLTPRIKANKKSLCKKLLHATQMTWLETFSRSPGLVSAAVN
jgi:hypothetical protein